MSTQYGKNAVTLYYIDGDSWSVYGREHLEGAELIRSVYSLLREKCILGPESQEATNRKALGDRTVEWAELYSDATMPAGTGLALVRTFDCHGNRVEYPGELLPLTTGISDVRMRNTEARPAIDLRSSRIGGTTGYRYLCNWVMDEVFMGKVAKDFDTATSAEVAVYRRSVSDVRKMAQILGRTKKYAGVDNDRIMGVLFRPVPDDNSEYLQMLLNTHHPDLAGELKTQWRSTSEYDSRNVAGHSEQSDAAEGSSVPVGSLVDGEGPAYDEYVGYYVGDPEDISRLEAEENR